MEEFMKPKYFAPVNVAFYPAAIEIFVLSFLSIFPNIYFLYKALTNNRFTKRRVLKKTVIILATEYMLASLHTTVNSLIYLIPYYFNLPISVIGCSWMRALFFVTAQIIFSTPFIIYIDRHFTIIQNKQSNPFLLSFIALIINLPAIVFAFGHKLDLHPIYLPDEMCTYQPFSLNYYIRLVQYPMMFTLVFGNIFAFLMNLYTFYKLQAQNKVTSQRRIKEQRQLFVTLTIQSIYPCICYAPGVLVGIYEIILGKATSWYVWRVTDALTYSSFGICVLLSVVFIKDFREMILIDLRLMKAGAITKTPIKVRTVFSNNNHKSQNRTSDKSASFKNTNNSYI